MYAEKVCVALLVLIACLACFAQAAVYSQPAQIHSG